MNGEKSKILLAGLILVGVLLFSGCGRPSDPVDRDVPVTIQTNRDWQPRIETINEVPMAFVPAGCFMMGDDDSSFDFEKPAHEQCIADSFWMDVTEVTVAAYRNEAGLTSDYPQTRITWFEANDYCNQRDARLPTEVEWEYAARGPDNLVYPWGNEIIDGFATFNTLSPEPVGLIPEGASWVGVLDMSGNVFEWVSSQYLPYPYNADDGREDVDDLSIRVIRGGGWTIDNPYYLRTNFRGSAPPDTSTDSIGSRCVRDSE